MTQSVMMSQTATGVTVRSILDAKGRDVWTAAPGSTVFEAIATMAEKSVGALLVMDGAHPMGVISERDYARKVILQGRSSKETRVREIMSSPVIFVPPSYTVEQCFSLMTRHRIRHLPVMDGDRLDGLLSIGDLVRATVSAQKETIDQLTRYILNKYPG
jgi:CBS domain-containing protein